MRYLFVVAHPDDEVLGAGAFIFDAVRNGDAVGVVVMRWNPASAPFAMGCSEAMSTPKTATTCMTLKML